MGRLIDAIQLKISIAYSNILEDGKTLDQIIDEQPTIEPERHLCRECACVQYYGEVDKHGNVESSWYCCNWDNRTDEEGFCHEWRGNE